MNFKFEFSVKIKLLQFDEAVSGVIRTGNFSQLDAQY